MPRTIIDLTTPQFSFNDQPLLHENIWKIANTIAQAPVQAQKLQMEADDRAQEREMRRLRMEDMRAEAARRPVKWANEDEAAKQAVKERNLHIAQEEEAARMRPIQEQRKIVAQTGVLPSKVKPMLMMQDPAAQLDDEGKILYSLAEQQQRDREMKDEEARATIAERKALAAKNRAMSLPSYPTSRRGVSIKGGAPAYTPWQHVKDENGNTVAFRSNQGPEGGHEIFDPKTQRIHRFDAEGRQIVAPTLSRPADEVGEMILPSAQDQAAAEAERQRVDAEQNPGVLTRIKRFFTGDEKTATPPQQRQPIQVPKGTFDGISIPFPQ